MVNFDIIDVDSLKKDELKGDSLRKNVGWCGFEIFPVFFCLLGISPYLHLFENFYS